MSENIREARIEEREAIAAIRSADGVAFGALAVEEDICLVAERDGELLAAACGDRRSGELVGFDASGEAVESGLAARLLAAAAERISYPELPAWLWLQEGEQAVLTFCEANGFSDSGWRRQLQLAGEVQDCLRLEWSQTIR